jgi:hypothetical protein
MKKLFAISAFMLGFSACSTTPTVVSTPGTELMKTARVVPVAVGQAVSLGTQVRGLRSMTMQSAQNAEFIHLQAKDPLGNPSLHVVFTTPAKVNDWYGYAKSLQSEMAGTTTLVGATTAHNIIAGAQENLTTLTQIVKAIDVGGGKDEFKTLVATTNSFEGLYVELKSGQWVSVNAEPKIVEQTAQTALVAGFVKAADALVQSNVADQLEDNWLDVLEPQTQTQRQILQQVASGNSLNMSAARAVLAGQEKIVPQSKKVNSGLTTQSESSTNAYCYWFLWWQVCVSQYDMEPLDANYMNTLEPGLNPKLPDGSYGVTNRGFGGGFNQYYNNYNQTAQYNISGENNSGCGPSALAALVNWHWQQGVTFDGQAAFANMMHYRSSNYGKLLVSTAFTGGPVTQLMARESDGRPKLSRMARSFVFGGGTATTPWDMEMAMHQYLSEQRNQYGTTATLESAYTLSPIGYGTLMLAAEVYRATGVPLAIASLVLQLPTIIAQTPFSYVYNLFRQPVFGDIMRRHIGSNNELVIALYPTGRQDWEAHYSAILKGRVIYHAVRPEILIEPLDKFNGRDWYSLSDPMSPFVGVFAINK